MQNLNFGKAFANVGTKMKNYVIAAFVLVIGIPVIGVVSYLMVLGTSDLDIYDALAYYVGFLIIVGILIFVLFIAQYVVLFALIRALKNAGRMDPYLLKAGKQKQNVFILQILSVVPVILSVVAMIPAISDGSSSETFIAGLIFGIFLMVVILIFAIALSSQEMLY